ncbi:exopolyphosphatase [Mangrovibacillus cuniculi]|uniref:Exopolyphosphatase n=1 Tax=Mangrovibacillus cuniculi TaxID=2593652 RepID=A0A7S8CA53_9BACI|nr:exopolyphosphatase [Mangrovibacillus cuniculi]QPC46167.1 exopolyphosphatase [Mangrovibacillus cuniculi]
MKSKIAIIDIGSNTIRLVIYDVQEDGRIKEIENVKTVARLRYDLDKESVLSDTGINKLLNALSGFKEIILHHDVQYVKAVATATIRQANNQETILIEVKEKTGIDIQILSEYEEAYYGFVAVALTTPVQSGITIDIGGGSTEITLFENKQLKHSHSFPFGVVSLKNQFLKGDSVTLEERKNLRSFIEAQLQVLPWLKESNKCLIAIGGSARNVAQMNQAEENYPIAGVHQYEMNIDSLERLREKLVGVEYKAIESIEGLSKDRADIIIPAIEVFHALYQMSSSTGIMVSRKGLREGIIFEEIYANLEDLQEVDVYEESAKELAVEFSLNQTHTNHMKKLSAELLNGLNDQHSLTVKNGDLPLIQKAAAVYYLGEYIDSESSSQHTFYILANRSINGLYHKERVKIAALASFKNYSTLKQYCNPFEAWITKEEIKKLRELGAILKIAYALNATKRNLVKKIEVKNEGKTVWLYIYYQGNIQAEQYQFEKQKKQLEKAIKHTVEAIYIEWRTE